jgi:transcriptional regulator with XRE-family HTH domain
VTEDDSWIVQRKVLGTFIKSQRQLAKLSLRDLAERTSISNPYLSQIERGIHEPSLRVLKVIAEALGLSADSLLAQGGVLDERSSQVSDARDTAAAIRTDPDLTDQQKSALLAVYQSYRETNAVTVTANSSRH